MLRLAQAAVSSLQKEKENIIKNPCVQMRPETKRLRQSSFKERYKCNHDIISPARRRTCLTQHINGQTLVQVSKVNQFAACRASASLSCRTLAPRTPPTIKPGGCDIAGMSHSSAAIVYTKDRFIHGQSAGQFVISDHCSTKLQSSYFFTERLRCSILL